MGRSAYEEVAQLPVIAKILFEKQWCIWSRYLLGCQDGHLCQWIGEIQCSRLRCVLRYEGFLPRRLQFVDNKSSNCITCRVITSPYFYQIEKGFCGARSTYYQNEYLNPDPWI